MTAGVRKIPPPMVEPTSTATALQKPSRRGSRSPQRSVAGSKGHSGPRYERSARLVVDELRRPRDSTLPRLGIDAGGPAGKVERLALPGSGEVLLHVAVVPCGVNRVMLPLMAVELKEMVAAVPRVLEPGYFHTSGFLAVRHRPAKVADIQVRRRLDQREHLGTLRGPQDNASHHPPLISLCSSV